MNHDQADAMKLGLVIKVVFENGLLSLIHSISEIKNADQSLRSANVMQ